MSVYKKFSKEQKNYLPRIPMLIMGLFFLVWGVNNVLQINIQNAGYTVVEPIDNVIELIDKYETTEEK
jgi:hypothetical protein